MPITIVNLTDGIIATATSDAGIIWSGRNGHLPNSYYHHNSSTACNIQARWFIRGVTTEFPRSDSARIGLIFSGVILTFLGVVGTIISAGTLGPAAALSAEAYWATALGLGISVVTSVGGIVMAVAPEIVKNKEALETVSQTERVSPTSIFKFTDTSPFRTVNKEDGSKEIRVSEELLDHNGMLKAKIDQPSATSISYHDFDSMRRNGRIFQIKEKDGKYADLTQAFINMNLQRGSNAVRMGGRTFDTSKIYQIVLNFPDRPGQYILKAGEDEFDDRVYLARSDADEVVEQQSNCYWQFIPSNDGVRHPGTNEASTGWVLVDRRYMRPLCLRDGEIRQYQSEEPGLLVQVDKNGVPFESRPEWARLDKDYARAVWQIDDDGHIRIPHSKLCVTARTDGGWQIYAREHGADDVYQTWTFVPH